MLSGKIDDAKTEERVLDACLSATDSVYGMIGIVNEHGNYDTTTYSGRSLQDCAFPEALAWDMSTGMTIRGIWGWPMLHGEPLICNDLKSHPARVGQPAGHVPIDCFLGVPLKREGKTVGMIAVANKPGGYAAEDRDILARLAAVMSVSRRHRDALREVERTAAELERSNTELEQFAYVASHDLQEPLRMVSSYLQLLERRYKDQLSSDADEYITFAVDGAKRMQTLLNDLLTFSRVETHGKPFCVTDCNGVLQQALANLSVAIQESEATITSDPLPSLHADPGHGVEPSAAAG